MTAGMINQSNAKKITVKAFLILLSFSNLFQLMIIRVIINNGSRNALTG
jgi:hypothetical protein